MSNKRHRILEVAIDTIIMFLVSEKYGHDGRALNHIMPRVTDTTVVSGLFRN